MNNFGVLKEQILTNLSKLYEEKNKGKIKNILRLIKEDKNFKDLYLLYDKIETTYVEDDLMEEYMDHIITYLREKNPLISETYKKLKNELNESEITEKQIYKDLDILSEQPTVYNFDNIIKAKRSVMGYLSSPKQIKESVNKEFTTNELLLYTVLTNNFNSTYSRLMSEEDKRQFKSILKLTKEDIEKTINNLKEDVLNKVENLMLEDNSGQYQEKLKKVKEEVTNITPSRFNYFRLNQLKTNL